MINIETMRNDLVAAQAALNKAREEGIRMSKDANVTDEELRKQMSVVERTKDQVQLLQEQVHAMEGEQSAKARAQQIADEDRIMVGAKAFKNSGDFFACVAGARGNMDARLAEYASIKSVATGQNITTDADGGYLVPPDYAAELLQFAQSASVLYPEVRKTSISGNRLVENYIPTTTRKDSASGTVGRSGMLAYWLGEADQYTASKMKFAQRETKLSKLTGLAYATDEILEDVPAMGGIIAEAFRDEFAFKIDDAILNGTGSGMPTGMLATGNGALVTVAKETSQAAGSILVANLLKMYNALPAGLRSRARWYCNQDVETILMQLAMKTANISVEGDATGTAVLGVPVWMPANGLSDSPYSRILGIPMVPVEQCSAVGTKGDIALLVPSEYRWIDKGGIKAQTSIHVRFDYDETAFKFAYRAGGRPMWENSIAAYKGSTVRSPYVALADRA